MTQSPLIISLDANCTMLDPCNIAYACRAPVGTFSTTSSPLYFARANKGYPGDRVNSSIFSTVTLNSLIKQEKARI